MFRVKEESPGPSFKGHWFWALFLLPCLGRGLTHDPSTAFASLAIGSSPRAVAMGENFTAVADDYSAIQYNPAGLSLLDRPQFFLAHDLYLNDGFFDDLGAAFPMGSLGGLALGFQYLNYGSLDLRDPFGNLQGSYTPFDLGLSGAFGFSVTDRISLGLGSRWVREDINGGVHMGLMWQAGFLDQPTRDWTLGADLRNIGLETGGAPLPADLLLGTSLRIPLAAGHSQELLVTTGIDLGFQGEEKFGLGAEYGIERSYFLRAGYGWDPNDGSQGTLTGLSVGAGTRLGEFQMDYSFSFQGDLGNVHRFSLSLFLPPAAAETKPSAAPVAIPPPYELDGFADINPPPSLSSPGIGAAGAPGEGVKGNGPVTLKFQVGPLDNLTAQKLFQEGETRLKMGLPQEAMEFYQKALERDPHLEKALARLGRLYFDRSLETYRELLDLEPQNDRLRDWLRQYPDKK